MRKITLIMFVLFTSTLAFGQYYLPAFPGNPRNLNNDPEETWTTLDGLNLNWVGVQASSSSDVWSATQTIPFSFTINGSAKTQYKVSTTGVLTFDLTATNVPSSSNSSLPSTSIPNNSICAWGLEVSGSNDYIASKTFGTSPNRQHWVSFLSASNPNESKTNYTYWSIVLEETTNRIYVVDQLQRRSPKLSIGVQYSSSFAVTHPATPNVSSMAGGSKYANDNFYYAFVPGSLPNFDFGGMQLILNDTVAISNAPFYIYGTFQNRGAILTQSVEMNYTINGGAPVTATISGLNIAKFTTGNISHPTKWTPSSTGYYDIKMWASKINNNNDADPYNDTISFTVLVVNSVGIDESEAVNFKLYPNPAQNNVTIDLPDNKMNISIEVIDLQGRTVYNKTFIHSEDFEINTSNFSRGIYFLKITNDRSVSSKKFILN